MNDGFYMRQALALAEKGLYSAHPNPRVGAVIVKADQVIGQGYHQQRGLAHAETIALQQAKGAAQGATCYVTLEPCAHTGLTGPCVHALIEAKIKRCVIACEDPNPLVKGQAIAALHKANIEITVGVEAAAATLLNQGFFQRMQQGRPWVRAKVACSLDGRVAMQNGESQWITGEAAREDAQHWRARSGAIITGIQTILKDDPAFTVRSTQLLNNLVLPFKPPLRVILDSQLRLSPNAKILTQTGPILLIIGDWITAKTQQQWLQQVVLGQQITLQSLPYVPNQGFDLQLLLELLAQTWQINEVLVETGPKLLGSFLQQQWVQTLICYVAPKLLGATAQPLAALTMDSLSQHLALKFDEVQFYGEDLRLITQVRYANQ
jgi:diaminohydroxyphosphoribosylaminopyrimidine deaminase/5-amino-6-(5-phosphoribosylamino)uracil reductase